MNIYFRNPEFIAINLNAFWFNSKKFKNNISIFCLFNVSLFADSLLEQFYVSFIFHSINFPIPYDHYRQHTAGPLNVSSLSPCNMIRILRHGYLLFFNGFNSLNSSLPKNPIHPLMSNIFPRISEKRVQKHNLFSFIVPVYSVWF